MSEDAAEYMGAPARGENGTKLLPRREPRGLLPSTWLSRTVRVEYTDASGKAARTSGTLLECYPVGPVLRLSGARTLVPWERLALVELVED